MIYIKRSVDADKDVTWVTNDLDENKRRNRMLYAGKDVNAAIKAAMAAGLTFAEAADMAHAEIDRCKYAEHNDAINEESGTTIASS